MLPSISRRSWLGRFLVATTLFIDQFADAAGYNVDINSIDSVHKTAKGLTDDMLNWYNGDKSSGIPGLLPPPYYWWEAGAMLGTLIEYWYYTGDSSYSELITEGLLFQVGERNDYMPNNQTLTEGNDDQGFWGLSVMSAAEYNFPNPPSNKPQWLALAQAVFNTQAARWETNDCNGGLRWQIFQWNKGYDYKNSISQGCFFALGARLALYTGNKTYSDWAEKTWNWMWDVNFIDHDTYYIIDGAGIGSNCTQFSPYQFSYNAGVFILGAAAMYNHTESKVWKDRLDNLLKGAQVFFSGPNKDIMTEVACEPVNRCNIDQQSFKAYLSRWLAACTQWAPDTYKTLAPYLKASAKAAINQCVGGDNGRMCGLKWSEDKYDGSTGVGQQMAAIEVLLATTIKSRDSPLTAVSGGTSKGDVNAGSDDIGRKDPVPTYADPTGGDKAGGAFLSLAILAGLFTAVGWLLFDETSDKKLIPQIKGSFAGMKASIVGGEDTYTGALAAGKGRSNKWSEKEVAVGSMSERGLVVGKQRNVEDMSVSIGHVRSTSDSTRRTSNMPLGWPRNSIARPGAFGAYRTNSADGRLDDDRITPADQNQI